MQKQMAMAPQREGESCREQMMAHDGVVQCLVEVMDRAQSEETLRYATTGRWAKCRVMVRVMVKVMVMVMVMVRVMVMVKVMVRVTVTVTVIVT